MHMSYPRPVSYPTFIEEIINAFNCCFSYQHMHYYYKLVLRMTGHCIDY